MTQENDGRESSADGPTSAPAEARDGRVSRRGLLRLTALGVGGVAGCSGRSVSGMSGGGPSTDQRPSTAEQSFDWNCEPDTSVERSGPLFTEFDARAAFRCLGDPFDSMENLDWWTAEEGTLAADERSVTGTQSARLRAAADDDQAWISRPFPDGIDLSDRNVSLAVRVGRANRPPGIYLQLRAPDVDNRIDMWYAFATDGWFRADPAPTKVVGDPDLTAVTSVEIGTWVGDGTAEFLVDSLRTTEKPDRGYVTFTFDDNLASQYETAFPALDEYGFPGVIGAIPDTVGLDGRMSVEELREVQSAGWDIVNHPQVADPLPKLTATKQRHLIERTKRWLLDEGFEDGARFAIWPYGAVDERTLDVARNYYYLGFGVGRSTSGFPVTGPLTVTRFDGNDVERTKRMLRFAAEYRTLAVPVYHSIGGDDAVSAETFAEVVSLVDELDLSVVTASDLWDEHLPSGSVG